MADREFFLLTIGYGGWTAHGINMTLSHYQDTWKDHLHEFVDGAMAVDCTILDNFDEGLINWTFQSPIPEPKLPKGTIKRLFGDPIPFEKEDSRLAGNAGSLDYASVDVYVQIAKEYGLRVFPVNQ